MSEVVLYGAAYSVYSRIARLALLEKGVEHRFVEVDIFEPISVPASYRRLQPFGKIPALSHGEFELYEASAITRYVDEAFSGPALQPSTPPGRGRMAQIVSLLDSYAYRSMVWDVFVERLRRPLSEGTSDEDRINAGLNQADLCLMVLSNFLGDGAWLAGEDLSLADLHAAPMVGYLRATSEGKELLERHRAMAGWWARIVNRLSMRTTATPYAADV